jgi:arsenical pump membrane protein
MPFPIREWMAVCVAAVVIVCFGWLGVGDTFRAVASGTDVYAFLLGIVAIAELARFSGVFERLAAMLLRLAAGSYLRLLAWVYALGTVVTIFLSNDTTAVILAPAVFAAVGRVRGVARPYLYACAFVANAASFVLPISNPANLVFFGSRLPPLLSWIRIFGLPSLAAIVLTLLALIALFRNDICRSYGATASAARWTRREIIGGVALAASALLLVLSAHAGWRIGYAAFGAAATSTLVLELIERGAARAVGRYLAWEVVLFVAGLYVIVATLDRHGALQIVRASFAHAQSLGPQLGALAIGGAVTAACAAANNLTVGLVAGKALTAVSAGTWAAHAAMVAVDLGPNLAASGSLATMLWLASIRREGLDITWGEFLRVGAIVVTPALTAALLLLR